MAVPRPRALGLSGTHLAHSGQIRAFFQRGPSAHLCALCSVSMHSKIRVRVKSNFPLGEGGPNA